ncbi:hypothetical protein F53441_12430 [Fusarium austroafricanum]|uniref:F-box domain-containing protein n=1 Tax=Fusarium austroafricanum TaxID=2364996 RepID=A0A8H4JZR1_9HYPO|nr:hypothetical protein F53441_12430 [Fusarium austroafricanum]
MARYQPIKAAWLQESPFNVEAQLHSYHHPMDSPPTLDTLPNEIQLQILSLVTSHDLSTLARTSKHFNKFVIPLLWTDIELHEAGYHESKYEIKVPPPVRDPERRPYHTKGKRSCGEGARQKTTLFFEILQTMHRENPEQLELVTKRIRHLCTVIGPLWVPRDDDDKPINPVSIQVWGLLPYFSNLETLELHGDYTYQYDDTQVSEITGPAPRLRFSSSRDTCHEPY